MRRIRTLFGIGLALGAVLTAIQVQALSASVSHAENFAALGDRARNGHMPILLVVSQEDCPYCELLKREILEPMLVSGEYDGRVLIRELLIDSELPVRCDRVRKAFIYHLFVYFLRTTAIPETGFGYCFTHLL